MGSSPNWSRASDARLVDEVRCGRTEAFGELVGRYERRLQRTIYRLVNDAEWARDLAQETFLRVYERLGDFDTSRRFGPWLFRIGVNLAVDQWRRRQRGIAKTFGGLDGSSADCNIEDDQPARELAEEVHAVLQQLPAKERRVLSLRDLEGFTCSEIAAITQRRESTVRWRLCRARKRFGRLWEARQQRLEGGSGR